MGRPIYYGKILSNGKEYFAQWVGDSTSARVSSRGKSFTVGICEILEVKQIGTTLK